MPEDSPSPEYLELLPVEIYGVRNADVSVTGYDAPSNDHVNYGDSLRGLWTGESERHWGAAQIRRDMVDPSSYRTIQLLFNVQRSSSSIQVTDKLKA